MSDSLSKFGSSYQSKLLACILSSPAFIAQVIDLIEPSYFETKSFKWLFDKIFKYYRDYKKTPTADALKILLDREEDELLRQEILANIRDSLSNFNSPDLEFIKTSTIDWCRNQKLKQAILDSVDLLKNEKYDEIKIRIDTALKLGQTDNLGLDYIEDIDKRYEEEARTPISTGWDVLDELMKGGLAPGELGVFLAPSGIGKSWLLMNIGAHALKLKKIVLYYTLELNESYCGIRFDCILTGIPLEKISLHRDRVRSVLEKTDGKLIIKWSAQKSISYLGIQAHIEKLKLSGVTPDLVIIDYADLLKYAGRSEDVNRQEKETYEQLRGMGGELGLPIWTVCQTNRSAIEESEITADKISGAYGKVFTADFVASLSRKRQDKKSNTARLHIIKNRFGIDGITFPVVMDTSRGYIHIHSESSEDGRKTIDKMKSDDQFNREIAAKKWAEKSNASKF